MNVWFQKIAQRHGTHLSKSILEQPVARGERGSALNLPHVQQTQRRQCENVKDDNFYE